MLPAWTGSSTPSPTTKTKDMNGQLAASAFLQEQLDMTGRIQRLDKADGMVMISCRRQIYGVEARILGGRSAAAHGLNKECRPCRSRVLD
jgi:hypothetical protein